MTDLRLEVKSSQLTRIRISNYDLDYRNPTGDKNFKNNQILILANFLAGIIRLGL